MWSVKRTKSAYSATRKHNSPEACIRNQRKKRRVKTCRKTPGALEQQSRSDGSPRQRNKPFRRTISESYPSKRKIDSETLASMGAAGARAGTCTHWSTHPCPYLYLHLTSRVTWLIQGGATQLSLLPGHRALTATQAHSDRESPTPQKLRRGPTWTPTVQLSMAVQRGHMTSVANHGAAHLQGTNNVKFLWPQTMLSVTVAAAVSHLGCLVKAGARQSDLQSSEARTSFLRRFIRGSGFQTPSELARGKMTLLSRQVRLAPVLFHFARNALP